MADSEVRCQSIVLRPGQVSLPAGGIQTSQPQLIAGRGIRVQGPGVRPTSAAAAITHGGRNVIINQPGMRPGQPGSQITVPLQTLQNMQPGQGIPTGDPGHLLVKTQNGQYQILKVGPSSTATVATTATAASPATPTAAGIQTVRPIGVQGVQNVMSTTMNMVQRGVPTPAKVVVASSPTVASTPSPKTNSTPTASASASSGASSGGGGLGGGMGTQMTPDTAKHKCKNFLATLLKLAGDQPPAVAANVRKLIQGLIDGNVDPETFTTKLQKELNSSPQPCLVPFLKKSLPYLQNSLRSGELTIDGVRAPPRAPAAVKVQTGMRPQIIGGATGQRPATIVSARPPITVMRTMSPNVNAVVRPGGIAPGASPMQINSHKIMANQSNSIGMSPKVVANSNIRTINSSLTTPNLSALTPLPPNANNLSATSGTGNQMKEKKSSHSISVSGDEDINDVAAMGGVNLAEESQRMQGLGGGAGTQTRSCKDETFLQTGLLHKRVAKICSDRGLEEPPAEVIALVSHATQDRLKTLLEKLSVIAEHRLDIVKHEGEYEVTQDVKGQLRFLGELDKIERRRHEEAERELLLRAAKSRTKTEDPEKEKLKAKAKELQRMEEEQLRHEKANTTALLAIGGPRKKIKLDEEQLNSAASGIANSIASRPRTKRVHVRDLMFLMEQEKELKRSPLLWKSYCS